MKIDQATVAALTPAQIAALDAEDQAELNRWLVAGAPAGGAPPDPWPPGHRFTTAELEAMTADQIAAHMDDVEASLQPPLCT